MGSAIWGVLLPACLIATWLGVRRPIGRIIDEIQLNQARVDFHRNREWLEAAFLTALTSQDLFERLRWDDARWIDEVHWARDRRTRRLLALVGVEFELNPFDDGAQRYATALFEYRNRRWIADGTRVDALPPAETLRLDRRYDPVRPPDSVP